MKRTQKRLLEKERGVVLDRTTRGTGQDIMEGFYGKELRRGCWRREGADRKEEGRHSCR